MSSALRVSTGLFYALLLVACSTAPPVTTQSMEDVEGIDATARELQVLLYQYAAHFSGQVDLAVSEVYYGSKDHDVRMAALEWYTNAVPEMTRSCLHFDPFTGLLGANAFIVQMDEFFTRGKGRDLFGEYQQVAVETSARLRHDLFELSHRVWPDGDFEAYKQEVIEWANAHPIENTRFVRGEFDYETARRSGAGQDLGFRFASSLNAQVLALTDRVNVATVQFPRYVHWREEILLGQATQMAAVMADSAVTHAVGNLEPLLEFIAEQRALTMRDIASERATVLEAIAHERNVVLVAIADERNATMRDLNDLSLKSLDRISGTSQATVTVAVDRLFDRMVRVMTIPFLLLGLLLIIIMIWVRNTVNRVLALRER